MPARSRRSGARFAHQLVTLDEAADLGCHACATPGGGCQFLGTAATSQVVAEGLGLTVPHAALAPSGQPIWLDVARRTADAVHDQWQSGRTLERGADRSRRSRTRCSSTRRSAARRTSCSTSPRSRTPRACGDRPSRTGGASTGRCRDSSMRLPNGPAEPRHRSGLPGRWRARGDAAPPAARPPPHERAHDHRTDVGRRARRVGGQRAPSAAAARDSSKLTESTLTMSSAHPIAPAAKAMTSTVCFPEGNLAPGGSVIKSTAIDPQRPRRRRGVPAHGPGSRVRERACRDRRDQGHRRCSHRARAM